MSESIATPIVTNTKIARGRAAERMRRSRQRRPDGLRCFRLDLRNDEIEALVRLRLLAPGEQTNRIAVTTTPSGGASARRSRKSDAHCSRAAARS
jgi:hypothetical protein